MLGKAQCTIGLPSRMTTRPCPTPIETIVETILPSGVAAGTYPPATSPNRSNRRLSLYCAVEEFESVGADRSVHFLSIDLIRVSAE
jgi:hypothetical protein